MTIVIDATPISPGGSAGVETFVYGLIGGLILSPDGDVRALIQGDTRADWERQIPGFSNYEEIRSIFNGGAGWQRALRKVAPASLAKTPLAGQLRRLRARAVDKRRDEISGLTYYPFHRTPATADEFVITVHDFRPFHSAFASSLDQSIVTENLERASAIVCSWPHPYADAHRLFPQYADKIFMIPLPVFNPPVNDNPSREANRSNPTLLYPAGLAPHKNHENLIRAMALLPAGRLICTGPPTEPLLTRLRALADELGLGSRVEFTGFVSSAEMQRYFAECDAVIVPTLWEAASGPLFEALAWGKPVIASRIGPITAQLDFANADAFLFDPYVPADIARAVKAWQGGVDPDYSHMNEWIWMRNWGQVAEEYRRVFDWVRGKAKPTDLQPTPYKENEL